MVSDTSRPINHLVAFYTAEADKVELRLRVPNFFCHTSLWKREKKPFTLHPRIISILSAMGTRKQKQCGGETGEKNLPISKSCSPQS